MLAGGPPVKGRHRGKSGKLTEAALEFTVPAGVTPDELRINAPDQSGVSVVSFHDKRT